MGFLRMKQFSMSTRCSNETGGQWYTLGCIGYPTSTSRLYPGRKTCLGWATQSGTTLEGAPWFHNVPFTVQGRKKKHTFCVFCFRAGHVPCTWVLGWWWTVWRQRSFSTCDNRTKSIGGEGIELVSGAELVERFTFTPLRSIRSRWKFVQKT